MPDVTPEEQRKKFAAIKFIFETWEKFSNATCHVLRQTSHVQTILRDKCAVMQQVYVHSGEDWYFDKCAMMQQVYVHSGEAWYLANWSPASKRKMRVARCVFLTSDKEWCNVKVGCTDILCRAHKIWLNKSLRVTRGLLPNDLSWIVVEYLQNDYRLLTTKKRRR
jgi:hypothetical protein